MDDMLNRVRDHDPFSAFDKILCTCGVGVITTPRHATLVGAQGIRDDLRWVVGTRLTCQVEGSGRLAELRENVFNYHSLRDVQGKR